MYCSNCHYSNHQHYGNLNTTHFRAVPEDELFSDGETNENASLEQTDEISSPPVVNEDMYNMPEPINNEDIYNIPDPDTNFSENDLNPENEYEDTNNTRGEYENDNNNDFAEEDYEYYQGVYNPYNNYSYNNSYGNEEQGEYEYNNFDEFDDEFNDNLEDEFENEGMRKCKYAQQMWHSNFQYPQLLPPSTPAPNYIPTEVKNLNSKLQKNCLKSCQSKWTFISLKDGNAFWIYMVYAGTNCIAGFRQNGCCVENYYFAINIEYIQGFAI